MQENVMFTIKETYRDLVDRFSKCGKDDVNEIDDLREDINNLYYLMRKYSNVLNHTLEYHEFFKKIKKLRLDIDYCQINISPTVRRRLYL